jgi:hypothetical protein
MMNSYYFETYKERFRQKIRKTWKDLKCGDGEGCVTVGFILDFIIGCWGYTVDREDSVS